MADVIKNNNDLFLVSLIMKFEDENTRFDDTQRKCMVWENLYLIRANNSEEAYDKTIIIGESECYNSIKYSDRDGSYGSWKIVGISELIPVYEDIEDGAELMWTDHDKITYKKALKMVKTKEEWKNINNKYYIP